MKRVVTIGLAVVAVAGGVGGCGGDDAEEGSTPGAPTTAAPHKPTNEELGQLGPASTGIGQECLAEAPSQSTLQGHVDTLIRLYRSIGPDTRFSLVPNAPTTTMRETLTRARDTLQACAQARVAGDAAQSLVDRINAELDKQ